MIVDIPEDTVLVEPIKEDYVWFQARGTATVVPEAKKKEESLEKVYTNTSLQLIEISIVFFTLVSDAFTSNIK